MILITGSNGQLGTELRNLFDEKNIDYIATDSSTLDITNYENTNDYIINLKPTVIYHCAAYTSVDLAEDEGKKINYEVNDKGTLNIVEAAKKVGAQLVYISTDYVFDGTLDENQEYREDDFTNPINEYGKAKLLGEHNIINNMNNYYIIRTSWVFGKYGNNFVKTMIKLSEERYELNIVNDQFGRPTWTRTLAEFMYFAVENNIDYGIYHLSNDNTCSWYEFAKEILKDKNIKINPVDSTVFKQKANRPKRSIMSLEKVKNTGFKIPTWQEALNELNLEKDY